MKVRGLNLNGVALFPTTEQSITACTHKYGAAAAWSHCTDRLLDGSRENAEINAFKNNLAVTAFVSPIYPPDGGANAYATGRVNFGIYLATDYWQNPITHAFEMIPSFYDAVWTQAASDAGLISQELVGTAKTERYPSCGQEMYDLTGGLYGYDVTNDIPGTHDVLSGFLQYNVDWFRSYFGRYPSNGSYGYGRQNDAYAVYEYFLGFRNSGYDYGYDYTFNHTNAVTRQTTTRQHDMTVDLSKTRSEVNTLCDGYLATAISNGGWYTDLTHWHTSPDTELEEYFASQRTAMGANDVVTLDFGTAIEYKFLRGMVRRISLSTVGAKLLLAVDTKNNDELKLDCIETALSVPISLTGTVLAGKEIKGTGDRGIKKVSADNFIVEVPYYKADGFQSVMLEETAMPTYLDFAAPSIISAVKSGSTITVVTDKPSNVVLFSTALGCALYTATVLARSNTMTTTHAINVAGISFTALDTYIGVITATKQSILSAKYNF